jgi:hypothetical protein
MKLRLSVKRPLLLIRPDTASYKIVRWCQKTGSLAVERPLPSLWRPLRRKRLDTGGCKKVPAHWCQKTGSVAVERPLPSLWRPLRRRRLDTGGWGRQSRGRASVRQTLP